MRYTVRKSIVQVIGQIWMPRTTAATSYELDSYAVETVRQYGDGSITRDAVARYLDTHAGDFQSVIDFSASIEDGDETIEIPWLAEESELIYNGAMFGDDD